MSDHLPLVISSFSLDTKIDRDSPDGRMDPTFRVTLEGALTPEAAGVLRLLTSDRRALMQSLLSMILASVSREPLTDGSPLSGRPRVRLSIRPQIKHGVPIEVVTASGLGVNAVLEWGKTNDYGDPESVHLPVGIVAEVLP